MRFHALVGSVGAVAGRSTAQACLSRRAVTPGYGDAALGTEGRAGLLWDFFFFCAAEKSFRNEETKTRNLGTSSGASHDDKTSLEGKISAQVWTKKGADGGNWRAVRLLLCPMENAKIQS